MNTIDVLQNEISWLERVIKIRLEFPKVDIFQPEVLNLEVIKSNTLLLRKGEYDLLPPKLENLDSKLEVELKSLSIEERLLLILALSTHLETGIIDQIIERPHYATLLDKYPAFWSLSGITSRGNYGHIPTGRFWIYLLTGNNLVARTKLIKNVIDRKIGVVERGLVEITHTEDYEPYLGGFLKINRNNLTKIF